MVHSVVTVYPRVWITCPVHHVLSLDRRTRNGKPTLEQLETDASSGTSIFLSHIRLLVHSVVTVYPRIWIACMPRMSVSEPHQTLEEKTPRWSSSCIHPVGLQSFFPSIRLLQIVHSVVIVYVFG